MRLPKSVVPAHQGLGSTGAESTPDSGKRGLWFHEASPHSSLYSFPIIIFRSASKNFRSVGIIRPSPSNFFSTPNAF